MTVSLFVNVDHIATLRQARGTRYPDPIHGAVLCERAGADGITVHLREDRRHVQDRDVFALREVATTRMNLEVAATDEMVALAKKVRPDFVTLVPEKREERTTEGGLDVLSQQDALRTIVADLAESSIPVSLFIDPEEAQLRAAAATGAHAVEFHTGDYANAADPRDELARLKAAAALSASEFPALEVSGGHGLTQRNVGAFVQAVPTLVSLHIGHALVSDSIFLGIEEAVRRFRDAIGHG